MSQPSQLEQAFQEAFCTNPVRPGDTVTCGCGVSHKSTLEKPLFCGEGPGGYLVVRGCECDFSASFGGMAWRYRHEIARFFNRMQIALKEDSRRLTEALPDLPK